MSTSTIREQVTSAAGSYASQYPTLVTGVIDAINEAGSVEAGKDYLRSQGYGDQAYLLDGITLPGTGFEQEAEGFDRETASAVIRAFIQVDTQHGEGEYQPDEVDALLILAGLEDEPVVEEPEVAESSEVSVDASLFSRLVDFARSHGFSG